MTTKQPVTEQDQIGHDIEPVGPKRDQPNSAPEGSGEWPGAPDGAMARNLDQRRGGDAGTPTESDAGAMTAKG